MSNKFELLLDSYRIPNFKHAFTKQLYTLLVVLIIKKLPSSIIVSSEVSI